MSQAALASAARLNLRTFCRYESGDSTPDSAAITSLCEALSISSDWLLGLVHPPTIASPPAVEESPS